MQVTKDMVVQRLAALRGQKEQVLAQANMLLGAIQDQEWLLAQFDAPEPQVEGEPEVVNAEQN